MNEASFEGLLIDYALGEIDDPDTKALLEALLEKDESLRASLAEIRITTELIVIAGPESLVGGSQSKRRTLTARSAWMVPVAGVAAALILIACIWWWPTATKTQGDVGLATRRGDGPDPTSAQRPTSGVGAQSPPWIITAAEKRNTRPSRRGAGIRWSALASSRTTDRQ